MGALRYAINPPVSDPSQYPFLAGCSSSALQERLQAFSSHRILWWSPSVTPTVAWEFPAHEEHLLPVSAASCLLLIFERIPTLAVGSWRSCVRGTRMREHVPHLRTFPLQDGSRRWRVRIACLPL